MNDLTPCAWCNNVATNRGSDGIYRCNLHKLNCDIAPFDTSVVDAIRAELAAAKALAEAARGVCRTNFTASPIWSKLMVERLSEALDAYNARPDAEVKAKLAALSGPIHRSDDPVLQAPVERPLVAARVVWWWFVVFFVVAPWWCGVLWVFGAV